MQSRWDGRLAPNPKRKRQNWAGKMVEVGPLSGKHMPRPHPKNRCPEGVEQGAGSWLASLTHEHRDQEPTDPLLLDLLDLGCSPWPTGLGHDCEGICVGNGTHGGGTEPRHPKQSGHTTHANHQQQVQMEAGALDHLALRFADNQPEGWEEGW